ncbi:ABC transporter permease [Agrobacterium albertimagni AOL15]|uniref:ABC transporter permease n=1 Tax=Agrobacterium albertimagni AOL15 TaxID=1156935 RepID=K2R0Y4_9HYPH|nr:iron ABC transporter permease [Agrobacterium albertimagni]EKF61487.1 ABC transporter permease [Agrobacterium albertimagni AOL15]
MRRLQASVTDPWSVLAALSLVFLLIFVALPLAELAKQAFIGQRSGVFGLENFSTFFSSGFFRRALFNSLVTSALATLLALALGLPLAFMFARYAFPGKRWIEVAILLSMLSPPFVGAYAWIILFGRSGFVTLFARDLGLNLPTIYGPYGIALASAFSLFPLVFLVVRGAFMRVDIGLEEAGASLGRPPWRVAADVTLPLVMPAITTAALLVFLGAISDFGTPAILGEGDRYPVLATLAYSLYISEIGAETGMAATTCMLLVLIAFGLVFGARFLATRRRVANDMAPTRALRHLSPKGGRWMAIGVSFFVAMTNLPLIVVLVSSVLEVRGVVFQPVLTVDNYTRAWAVMGSALSNSLMFAGTALVATVILGTALGYYVTRRTGPLARAIDLLVMIPYVVPGTVIGIGYAQVFNGPPIFLTGTATVIGIVYLVRRLPYMTRAASSVVFQIDQSLEEASQNLGMPPAQGFARIMVPLMRPAILAGAAIAWVEILNELSASIVLYTGATRTLPIAAYQQSLGGDVGIAAAYAAMLVGVTVVALLIFFMAGGLREDRGLAAL